MAVLFSTPEGSSGVIFRASPRVHPKADADGAHLPARDDQRASKGARDDVNFREVREGVNARQPDCIFCNLSADRVIASNALAFAIRDNYPVTQLGQVRELLDILTWISSFEGFALRPTIASYS